MTNFNWTDITNPKKPVFIIAEAASNWKSDNYENDLKQSKKLIDASSLDTIACFTLSLPPITQS